MQWSLQQETALSRVNQWLKKRDRQIFHMFGYAGTGKTTLAKHFASGVDGKVLFGAFTGKASYVLQQKGCDGAATIHSMIYNTRDKSQKRLREIQLQHSELKEEIRQEESVRREDHSLVDKMKRRLAELQKMINDEKDALKHPHFVLNRESEILESELVIIDECSMVDGQMGQDLLSFGKPVLVLGDPAQLPPVGGAGYFTKDVTPDVMLDEIHRQAEDSPIIRMATKIRNQQALELGDYGEGCCVLPEGGMTAERALTYDQILVGKNATRFGTNKRVRGLKGYDDVYPVIGDKLVCLRNNHDEALLNGSIFEVQNVTGVMDDKVFMELVPEDGDFAQDVAAHVHHFEGNGKDIPWFQKKEANEFDFGYALTVHKAQGSQWDNVLLFDEAYCFRQDRWKWLYTGITRAAESVTIVKM